ncbi:MAG: ABC transporter substrate-binding protein [Caldicoprobacter sp.]|uniref:ABC transporter substrate-binding protein n=1 Tax=Caldicoprobacter sp. TaxID=2004500 RepID=UPI0039C116F7
MKKAIVLALAVVLMLSLVLTGCSSASDDSKTPQQGQKEEQKAEEPSGSKEDVTLRIVWWGSQQRADLTVQVLDMFSEKYPNVKFEHEFAAWNDYWDKMATYVAANSLPDIVQHDYAKIKQYVDNNLLADLTPYVESGKLDLSDVDDNFLAGGKFDGKLYAVPLGINALGMLLDPAVLEKAGLSLPGPGWTWEDFEEMCKTIYEKTGVMADIPLVDDPKFMIEYFARSVGKSMFSADGKSLGFDDPSIIQDFFEMELRMLKAGVTPSPEELLISKPVEESNIVVGRTFGGPVWSNFAVVYSDTAQRPLKLVIMPKYSKGDKPGLYIKPSQFFCIAESSQHKDIAVEFLNFWTNDIEANKVLKAERGVPISKKVREALADTVSESVLETFKYIDSIVPYVGPIDPPEPAAASEVTALIKEVNEEVLFQRITPEEAAKKVMERANEILARGQ